MRLVIALVVVLGSASLRADVSAPSSAGAIHWRTDLDAAAREAAKTGRPLLVYFSAEWCMPCVEMRKKSFADAAVVDVVSRRFVPVLVDVTQEDAAATAATDRFHVRAMPTVLVWRAALDRVR
jgi:thioredoxin 1